MPSARGHEADARSKRQVVAAEAGGIQRRLSILRQNLARPASRKSVGISRKNLIAAGVFLAIGNGLPARAADPNEKTAAAEKAWLTRIAAEGQPPSSPSHPLVPPTWPPRASADHIGGLPVE